MFPILKKEFHAFFSSPIAYLVIGIFLLINGLFLWIFDDNFNILYAGYADINNFFYLSPWVFLLLAPAITMRMFSDELSTGTIETLLTKPLTLWQIVFGKFLACLLLIVITIALTFVHVYSVYQLGNPIGNIDLGSTIGSYIGLLLLTSSYISIGLFASTLSKNQIIAFLLSMLIIFVGYYGFDALFRLLGSDLYFIQSIGFNEHYKSLSKGVVDSRDILYFLSVIFFFLFLTKIQLKNV